MSDIEAIHRRRLSSADAHYGGGLVAGAKVLELFGDLATELCIRSDGDEGLFAGYSSVEFLAPLHAGDFIEVRGHITRTGTSSREMSFAAVRYASRAPEISESAADTIDEEEVVARAIGTCVVRKEDQRKS